MSDNTAKVVDFEVFRTSRRAQAPALAAVQMMQTDAAPTVAAATPFVWQVYWVYFPAVYVATGY